MNDKDRQRFFSFTENDSLSEDRSEEANNLTRGLTSEELMDLRNLKEMFAGQLPGMVDQFEDIFRHSNMDFGKSMEMLMGIVASMPEDQSQEETYEVVDTIGKGMSNSNDIVEVESSNVADGCSENENEDLRNLKEMFAPQLPGMIDEFESIFVKAGKDFDKTMQVLMDLVEAQETKQEEEPTHTQQHALNDDHEKTEEDKDDDDIVEVTSLNPPQMDVDSHSGNVDQENKQDETEDDLRILKELFAPQLPGMIDEFESIFVKTDRDFDKTMQLLMQMVIAKESNKEGVGIQDDGQQPNKVETEQLEQQVPEEDNKSEDDAVVEVISLEPEVPEDTRSEQQNQENTGDTQSTVVKEKEDLRLLKEMFAPQLPSMIDEFEAIFCKADKNFDKAMQVLMDMVEAQEDVKHEKDAMEATDDGNDIAEASSVNSQPETKKETLFVFKETFGPQLRGMIDGFQSDFLNVQKNYANTMALLMDMKTAQQEHLEKTGNGEENPENDGDQLAKLPEKVKEFESIFLNAQKDFGNAMQVLMDMMSTLEPEGMKRDVHGKKETGNNEIRLKHENTEAEDLRNLKEMFAPQLPGMIDEFESVFIKCDKDFAKAMEVLMDMVAEQESSEDEIEEVTELNPLEFRVDSLSDEEDEDEDEDEDEFTLYMKSTGSIDTEQSNDGELVELLMDMFDQAFDREFVEWILDDKHGEFDEVVEQMRNWKAMVDEEAKSEIAIKNVLDEDGKIKDQEVQGQRAQGFDQSNPNVLFLALSWKKTGIFKPTPSIHALRKCESVKEVKCGYVVLPASGEREHNEYYPVVGVLLTCNYNLLDGDLQNFTYCAADALNCYMDVRVAAKFDHESLQHTIFTTCEEQQIACSDVQSSKTLNAMRMENMGGFVCGFGSTDELMIVDMDLESREQVVESTGLAPVTPLGPLAWGGAGTGTKLGKKHKNKGKRKHKNKNKNRYPVRGAQMPSSSKAPAELLSFYSSEDGSTDQTPLTLAEKMKLQNLALRFPSVEMDVIASVFKHNNRSQEDTLNVLRTTFGNIEQDAGPQKPNEITASNSRLLSSQTQSSSSSSSKPSTGWQSFNNKREELVERRLDHCYETIQDLIKDIPNGSSTGVFHAVLPETIAHSFQDHMDDLIDMQLDRISNFQEAAKAYSQGKKTTASVLSGQGKANERYMLVCAKNAADAYVSELLQKPQIRTAQLDLHGLPTKHAVVLVCRVIILLECGMNHSKAETRELNEINIITGRGLHSFNKKGKIKQRIGQLLSHSAFSGSVSVTQRAGGAVRLKLMM